jgi:hypothetical protein
MASIREKILFLLSKQIVMDDLEVLKRLVLAPYILKATCR